MHWLPVGQQLLLPPSARALPQWDHLTNNTQSARFFIYGFICSATHWPLMHWLPVGQQLAPQTWESGQHAPLTQTWPRAQHLLPHCAAALQHLRFP